MGGRRRRLRHRCGVFAGSYAVAGSVADIVPVDLRISGCPPTPTALLKGLMALLAAPEIPTVVPAKAGTE